MFQHQQYRQATFENYTFQIPPKLCFEKDGNEQYGENLFVYDPQEKYLISFESGMPCFDLRYRENPNYRSEEYGAGHIKINLCYPGTLRTFAIRAHCVPNIAAWYISTLNYPMQKERYIAFRDR